MASNPGALSGWRESVDMAARDVDVDLGVFADLAEAHEIARQFAFLGAVDEIEDASGIRLVVSYLKPGVVREDVEAFASDLGLVAIVRY
jgi:rare lipoprotein A